MTELNAKEILKKYEKNLKVMIRIRGLQKENINNMVDSEPFIRKYSGSIGMIEKCLRDKITKVRYSIEYNQQISILLKVENDFISRVLEEEICIKMEECFSYLNNYSEERIVAGDDKESRKLLVISMRQLYDSVKKIPEFANSHSR